MMAINAISGSDMQLMADICILFIGTWKRVEASFRLPTDMSLMFLTQGMEASGSHNLESALDIPDIYTKLGVAPLQQCRIKQLPMSGVSIIKSFT